MRRTVTGLLAVLALALSACGGDDQLSAGEYRAQARTICQEDQRAIEGIDAPTRATPRALVAYFRSLSRVNQRTIRRFDGLEPPSELQGAHDDVLRANRQGAAEVQRVIDRLEGGEDPREVLTQSRGRLQQLVAESNRAVGRLGVRECASEPR